MYPVLILICTWCVYVGFLQDLVSILCICIICMNPRKWIGGKLQRQDRKPLFSLSISERQTEDGFKEL